MQVSISSISHKSAGDVGCRLSFLFFLPLMSAARLRTQPRRKVAKQAKAFWRGTKHEGDKRMHFTPLDI